MKTTQNKQEPTVRKRTLGWEGLGRMLDMSGVAVKRIVTTQPDNPITKLVKYDEGAGRPFAFDDEIAAYKEAQEPFIK